MKVEQLMHDEACGHVHMDPRTRHDKTLEILATLNIEDVNAAVAVLLKPFLTDAMADATNDVFVVDSIPAAVTVCAPTVDARDKPFIISKSEVIRVF